MATPSLLFIPDISGFTHFVNVTEVTHSQHIIAELLELLIDTDQLGLIVSEIEGDAILFYKHEEVPSIEELLKQGERMFLAFHNHLARYERQRICDCGACSNASSLSLKIVAHQGDFGIIKVKDFRKPYGSDVILAHRLLKNEIHTSEYLLLTPELLKGKDRSGLSQQFPWAKLEEGNTSYEDLGELFYEFTPFSPLRKKVSTSDEMPRFKGMPNPIVNELFIERSPKEVYEQVINLELRTFWNVGVKKVIYPESRVNRVGTSHTCVLPLGTLKFETVQIDSRHSQQRVYAEQIKDAWFAEEMMQYFEFTPEKDGTHVRFEIHVRLKPWFRWFAGKMLRGSLIKGSRQSLAALKELCEINPQRK